MARPAKALAVCGRVREANLIRDAETFATSLQARIVMEWRTRGDTNAGPSPSEGDARSS